MKVNDILKNKKLVLLYVIIVVEFILLVLFTIPFITIEAYVILFVSNLIIGIIALTIPFVMKSIEKKEKQEEKQLKKKKREDELRDRIKQVINPANKNYQLTNVSST